VNPYREAGARDEAALDVEATRGHYRRASLERRAFALAVVAGALASLVALGSQTVLRDVGAGPSGTTSEPCVEDTMPLYSLHMRLDPLDEPAPLPPRACTRRSGVRLP
jgi:hypothetical protein